MCNGDIARDCHLDGRFKYQTSSCTRAPVIPATRGEQKRPFGVDARKNSRIPTSDARVARTRVNRSECARPLHGVHAIGGAAYKLHAMSFCLG